MVAAQLYNQETPKLTPIEITLIQTDCQNTAALFAQTLHENTITLNAETDSFKASISPDSHNPEISILLTSERLEKQHCVSLGCVARWQIRYSGGGVWQ